MKTGSLLEKKWDNENESLLRSLLSTLPDPALILDRKGIILTHNELALQAIDKKKAKLTGLDVRTLFPPDIISEVKNMITEILIRNEPGHFEGRYQKKLYAVFLYPLVDRKNLLHHIAVFARDITERRKIEESEIRKSLRLEKLLETARNLTSSLEIIEVLSQIGKQASELLRAYASIYLLSDDGQQLIPKVVIDPTYEEEIMSAPLDVEGSLTGKSVKLKKCLMFNDVITEEEAYQIPGTSELDNERLIAVPFISDGKVLGAMCLNRIGTLFTNEDMALAETFGVYAAAALKNAKVFNDLQHEVEERRKAEIQLSSHQEHLRIITKILRHDIINNLGIIKSSLNLYDQDSSQHHYLNDARGAINKSIDLINRMRELENYLLNHQDLRLYDLNSIIKEVLNNYSELTYSITGEGSVLADEAIISIFDNIIRNSIIHGRATHIDISIKSTNRYHEIRFSDNGSGIPAHLLDRIFDESFFYGETGHTGIGLHIVKTTVERYGGFVYAESNKPRGTVMVMALKKIN